MTAELTAEFQSFVSYELKLSEDLELRDSLATTESHVENAEPNQDPLMIQNNINLVKLPKEEIAEKSDVVWREETPDYIPLTVREKFHVLRIEEDNDIKHASQRLVSFKVKADLFIPRDDLNSAENSIPMKKLENPIIFHDDLEVMLRTKETETREPPIPPARRRSVKDIIDSINRSQQLLKLNQSSFEPKFESKFQCDSRPAVPPKSFKLQQQNEEKINALLADLQNFN